MALNIITNDLTDAQFESISSLVKRVAGINLHEGKRELVKSRLNKRLRALKMDGFDQYIKYLAADNTATELVEMLDAISTNLTSFFRENSHFEFFSDQLLPRLAENARKSGRRRLRGWSAGCSSGEEPYTIAMCLRETLADLNAWDARVLATDLCTKVLANAQRGIYAPDRLEKIPPQLRSKYFTRLGDGDWQAGEALRGLITFARLNLMEPWPMSGPFDFIFCRNVMIYFDKPTQARLVERYWQLLDRGGVLFIGHSESLTGVEHRFRYIQPTVYQKT